MSLSTQEASWLNIADGTSTADEAEAAQKFCQDHSLNSDGDGRRGEEFAAQKGSASARGSPSSASSAAQAPASASSDHGGAGEDGELRPRQRHERRAGTTGTCSTDRSPRDVEDVAPVEPGWGLPPHSPTTSCSAGQQQSGPATSSSLLSWRLATGSGKRRKSRPPSLEVKPRALDEVKSRTPDVPARMTSDLLPLWKSSRTQAVLPQPQEESELTPSRSTPRQSNYSNGASSDANYESAGSTGKKGWAARAADVLGATSVGFGSRHSDHGTSKRKSSEDAETAKRRFRHMKTAPTLSSFTQTVGARFTERLWCRNASNDNTPSGSQSSRRRPNSLPAGPLSNTPDCLDQGEDPGRLYSKSSSFNSAPVGCDEPVVVPVSLPQALRESALQHDAERVEELLSAGVSVNLAHVGVEGEPAYVTLLHSLCGVPGEMGGHAPRGSLAVLELLLKAHANLNPRSSDGCTPLICACRNKNVDAAKLLLEWKADVTPCDDGGLDCLTYAIILDPPRLPKPPAQRSRTDFAVLHHSMSDLCASSCHSGATSSGAGTAAFAPARPCDDAPVLTSTPPHAENEIASNLSFRTLPSQQEPSMPPSVVPSLPSPRDANDGNVSAMLVQALLAASPKKAPGTPASPQSGRSNARKKQLKWSDCVGQGHQENWQLGQSNSAHDYDDRRKSRSSPLLTAVRHLNHEAASALLESGVPPMWLHEAVETGSMELVRVLLKARADPTARNEHGDSPMDIALQMSEDDIMDALREAAKYTDVHSLTDSQALSPRRRCGHQRSITEKRRMSRAGTEGTRRYSLDSLAARIVDEPPKHKGCTWYAWKFVNGIWWGLATLSALVYPLLTELSALCRRLCRNHTWQAIMFMLLIGALFLPDMWILIDARDYRLLDAIILAILAGFVAELFVQVLGLRMKYLLTFFFCMDLVGAGSLLLDLSACRNLGWNRDSLGDNAVVMRAARAARLGARAGRFTRLVKLLRFLPGSFDEGDVGVAKVLSRILVTKLSTRVSCLILVLVMVLPLFDTFMYPEQDWAMQMWTEQLADAIDYEQSGARTDAYVMETLEDFRSAFGRGYFPYRFSALVPRNSSIGSTLGVARTVMGEMEEVILWQGREPFGPDNELQKRSGNVLVSFDFSGVRRTEAATNIVMIIFTTILMVVTSLVISNSVSTIALIPLEQILADVRTIGRTIYRNVQHMQKKLNCGPTRPSLLGSKSGDDHCDECYVDEWAAETDLLESVVRKLAALSEITMRRVKPNDEQTLQYLGEMRDYSESLSKGTDTPATKLSERSQVDMVFHPISLEGSTGMQFVGDWNFNTLQLDGAQNREVCAHLLKYARGRVLVNGEDTVAAFVDTVAGKYLKTPKYHNWAHAVDVAHVLFTWLHVQTRPCNYLMSPLEDCALLVSAISHDIGHMGVNNDFLVQTRHELAICYNDTSPLENMHCASLFEILRVPRTAIFAPLTREQYREVRNICIEAILHTDSANHVTLVKRLQMFGEVNNELLLRARDLHLRTQHSVMDGGDVWRGDAWPPRELSEVMSEADSRSMLRSVLLHAADISNPVRPFAVCSAWAHCILDEFFNQGDMERQRGLPVHFLNDREKTSRPFSQISFIEFFVAPLVFAIVRVLAPLEELNEHLATNASYWMEEWQSEVNPSDEEIQPIANRVKRLEEAAKLVDANSMARQRSRRLSQTMG